MFPWALMLKHLIPDGWCCLGMLKQVIGLAEVGLWGLAFKSYILFLPLAQTLS